MTEIRGASESKSDLLTRPCIRAYMQPDAHAKTDQVTDEWTVTRYDNCSDYLPPLEKLTDNRHIPWARIYWYPSLWGRIEVSDHEAFDAQMLHFPGLAD